ncbi:MAG: extracellular solute-binding protein [Selenomonas sp.]|uniref:ABC transporter substrate-binding protein n=1 Tax=Selenomonas sp. TaxID=2053611 RepID=UPI0025EE46E3|nr:extracellular solute-binding protein [Selenomonas sp.]MCI6232785.1 extracellular solute-binding protein [Selenomonas sp.]
MSGRGYSRWRIVMTPLVILLCAVMLCYALRPAPHVLRVGIFVGSPWGVPGGDPYGLFDESIAAFEEAHPGVKVTYVSGISRDDYGEWLAECFLAGDEPDVFLLLPEDFELYAAQGALLPLAPLEKDDAVFDASAFYPAAFAYGQYGGESMALPLACMTRLMFVNKTLLAREGIAMPGNHWTFDDFYRIAAAVTRDTDGDGTLDQFGAYDYSWQLAATATGAQLFRDDGRASYLAAPEVEQAVRFCMKLSALTRGHQVTPRDFDLGRVAFRPLSFAEYRTYKPYPWRIKKYMNFEWDCIPLPEQPGGTPHAPLGVLLAGISARTHEKALAWDFLKEITTSDEAQKSVLTHTQGLPAKRGIIENSTPADVFGEGVTASLTPALLGETLDHAVTAPKFKRYDGAMLLADTEIAKLVAGTVSFDNALNRLQKEVNAYLQR